MSERTVWKFELTVADNIQIEMPKHSEVLHFDVQRDTVSFIVHQTRREQSHGDHE